ncbi:MAG: hypothetical protein ACW99X_15665 [Candidatus Thorarchaeota archaeon]
MTNELNSGYSELIEPERDYSSLVQNPDEYQKLVETTRSEIKPSWKSQSIATLLIFAIISYGPIVYFCISNQITQEDSFLLFVVMAFWVIFVISLQSCYRLTRILNNHVKKFFLEGNFVIHRFQDRFLSAATKDESKDDDKKTKRKTIAIKNTASHYNLRNSSTKLIRKTRGVISTFIILSIETILFLALLNSGPIATNFVYSWLNLVFIVIMFQLIVTSLFVLVGYVETELAIHAVLDKSKRNLVELSDLMIIKTTIDRREDIGELKVEYEATQLLFTYFTKLPTWTVDSKIAASIGGGIVVQIAAITMTILNILLT